MQVHFLSPIVFFLHNGTLMVFQFVNAIPIKNVQIVLFES